MYSARPSTAQKLPPVASMRIRLDSADRQGASMSLSLDRWRPLDLVTPRAKDPKHSVRPATAAPAARMSLHALRSDSIKLILRCVLVPAFSCWLPRLMLVCRQWRNNLSEIICNEHPDHILKRYSSGRYSLSSLSSQLTPQAAAVGVRFNAQLPR